MLIDQSPEYHTHGGVMPPAAPKLLTVLIICLLLLFKPVNLHAAGEEQVLGMIGPQDALILSGPDKNLILEKNINTPLVPASTLKLLTALAVMDTLGQDYQFETRFYTGPNGNLKIKGFGDPLLISEVLAEMAARVFKAAEEQDIDIRDIFVDDTYFSKPINIPGVTPSTEPYDAPVGAFCANFNTVNYRVKNNILFSAEPQTPLLPFARKLIQKNPPTGGRIVLSHNNDAIALYGGHLFGYFMEKNHAVRITRVGLASVDEKTDTLLLTCRSPFTLTEAVKKMMEFSNNFIANQLVIASGAKKYGSPGTIEKAVRLLETYGLEKLNISNATLVEGSGISRLNRISAQSLLRIVEEFEPYYSLLRHRGDEYFKTGTLKGISTRVGYIQHPAGGRYRFVIMVNTPGKSAEKIKQALASYMIRNYSGE